MTYNKFGYPLPDLKQTLVAGRIINQERKFYEQIAAHGTISG